MTIQPALILIDFQTGFDAPSMGPRNNRAAETRAAALLSAWRQIGAPVMHVRHLSQEPGSPLAEAVGGADLKPEVAALSGEPVFDKTVNNAFQDTGLEAHLRGLGMRELVICGLTTPHCVSTSVRVAANLGFSVTLAHDACAAFAANADVSWLDGAEPPRPEEIHAAAVSHLHGEFARATTTDAILAAVL